MAGLRQQRRAQCGATGPGCPALGNHEVEFGTDTIAGHPGHAPGGIAAQGAAGNYWNGPYGFGHYLSRFLLPDNGVTNWDGNRLRGNFYAFQVGTVKFISLDADDVIYQDGAANYVIDTANTAPETTTTGASIPNGTTRPTPAATPAASRIDAKDNSLVPDYASGKPNLQTIWLDRTLAKARHDPSVDMIVVFMHQCAMSTSVPGNGSDLGIRQAWLPLFDKYEVDLVLSGHEHDYERTVPGPRLRRRGARHRRRAQPRPGQGSGRRHPAAFRGGHRAARRQRHPRVEHRRGHGHWHRGGRVRQERRRLGGGRALVRGHQPDRRLRLLDLRRRPRPASRGDHDHLPVLRDPGGDQRGRLRARRHHHAADAAHREVRLRPPGGPSVAAAPDRMVMPSDVRQLEAYGHGY